MTFCFGPPVLAFGFNEFLTIAVVVISVIAWIIRTVQGNNQQLPPPVQRPGRRRDERGDEEIDTFLEQVNRNQPPARTSRSDESRNESPSTRSKKTAPPPPTPAKQRQPVRQLAESLPSNSTPRPPLDSSDSRKPGSNQDLSQGMKQHLKEYMGERVAKEAQKDLGQSLSSTALSPSASNNLGSLRAAPIPTAKPAVQREGANDREGATTANALTRTNNLRKALRNPQMISQAIIVQEVLSRPKSLRK